MKTSIFTIFKIEVTKLFKRKDWLVLLALIGVSILMGAAISSEGYTGVPNQSALLWASSQILNSSLLFITPLIFAFLSTRILASEIENGSILLYTNKYRNRGRMYLAKSLALLFFSIITLIIMFLVNIFIYYLLVNRSPVYASGNFFGENTALLWLSIVVIYLSSFILASQCALCLSSFLKPAPIIGIMFFITMLLHNTFKTPVFQIINPWHYVALIGADVNGTSDYYPVNWGETTGTLLSFFLLVAIYVLLFNFVGKRKFEKMDL